MSTLAIVELGEVCARFRARSLDLFERLGTWVVTTPEPDLQRLLAEACHRHAWHAELWARRCPTIPPVDLDRLTDRARRPLPDTEHRRRWYAAELAHLIDELDALADRVDPLLDPGTDRTIRLVRHDLTDLVSAC